MSVMRYYKVIQPYEIPTDTDVINILKHCIFRNLKNPIDNYLYTLCSLAPLRNRAHLHLHHNKLRFVRFM